MLLTLVRCPFHPSVTTVTRKIPRSFYQKCRWHVTPKHAYTLYPTKLEWADYAAVQAYCGNLSGDKLTRNLSRNIQPQSSQLAEPLWPDPGIKFGISVRELISTSKHQQKSAGGGMNGRTFSPKASQEREKPPPPSPLDFETSVLVTISARHPKLY